MRTTGKFFRTKYSLRIITAGFLAMLAFAPSKALTFSGDKIVQVTAFLDTIDFKEVFEK